MRRNQNLEFSLSKEHEIRQFSIGKIGQAQPKKECPVGVFHRVVPTLGKESSIPLEMCEKVNLQDSLLVEKSCEKSPEDSNFAEKNV